ncbi:MAG TPA: hypothetical protein P5218_03420 [Planctomycetota bacterium]|nr:hypothetical protein [Planctomycetota bacterium]
MPLPEAITLAGSLMMVTDDVIEQCRAQATLDEPTKNAMLEVGNFIAGATEAAFRALEVPCKVSFEGCQGVKADVRPRLLYSEGEEMVTSSAQVQLAGYGESEFLLLVPRQTWAAKAAA